MTGFKTEQEAIDYIIEHGASYFIGMNCNDYTDDEVCDGWDGNSRRCECGNRRVSIVTEKKLDGNWFAYGEAY